MVDNLPRKHKQFFLVLIKLGIILVASCFIYVKLYNNSDLNFNVFTTLLFENNVFSEGNIVFLMVFTFFNWFFEVLKWQKLVGTIKEIKFKEALGQCLGALTASLFTPNRIGEYGAKAMYYTSEYRKRIVFVNLFGNLIQMGVTSVFGVIGLYVFCFKFKIVLDYYKIGVILIVGCIIFILIRYIVRKYTWFSIEKIKQSFLGFPKKTIAVTLLLSVLRYIMFSTQFYVLLRVFKSNISFVDAAMAITSMYLLTSIIPSIFIFDVVIKGSVALYLFSFFGVNTLTVLSIVTFMWLLNFVLPSVFGGFYVLRFNLPKDSS